jgi:hypothetical protein
MSDKIGVRIVATNPAFPTGSVHVFDAVTGMEMSGVMNIDIHIPVEGVSTATIQILAEVDLETEGVLVRYRHTPDGLVRIDEVPV